MRPLSALQVFDDRALHSAPMNMAIDEALLESTRAPALRFYCWERPSVSFGYFNRYAEVAALHPERAHVRRWTGGGIVLHGDDLTYSFILPAAGCEKLPSSREVYAEVHEALRSALPPGAILAQRDAPRISDACFANPVLADVLLQGAKVAGAAQRRTRAGLLHQGSIQMPQLPQNFRNAFAAALCRDFETRELNETVLARATEIVSEKYGIRSWLTRR